MTVEPMVAVLPAGGTGLFDGRYVWFKLSRSPLAMVGLVIIVVVLLTMALAPLIAPYDPNALDLLHRLAPPGPKHWFGTDQVGRDVFARVVYGVRLSLFIGFLVTMLESFVGITLGAVAGWSGKWADAVIMRIVDVLLAIPYFVLAVAFIQIVGRGVTAVIVTLVVTSWLTTARVVRGSMLQSKRFDYVEAARAIGVPTRRIVTRHILPNIIQPILVLAAIGIGSAVLAEAALSFLGVGVQEPTPSLGLMISRSNSFFSEAPGLLIFPGLAIVLTVLGFLLIGDGLRDALDVKDEM